MRGTQAVWANHSTPFIHATIVDVNGVGETNIVNALVVFSKPIHVHPFLEELDRFQKWPTVESSLNVYRNIASHFKCLFKDISVAVFEKRHCQFLP